MAVEGGGDVGSRVLGAASACLVASGLFLCGLGGALALAQPSAPPVVPADNHPGDDHDKGPKGDPEGTGGSKASTEKDTETKDPDGKPDTGGNPSNGNCGNDKDNGNAQGCGGGASTQSSPPSPTPSTKTSESSTSKATSTSRETTTSKSTSSESSETTTPSTTTSVGLPAPGGGGGGGGAPEAPAGGGALPPKMQLPPEMLPPATEPSVIDVLPGVGAAAADLPIPPITLPVIVAPAAGLGGGVPPAPVLKGMPRGVTAEPPAGREPLPAAAGSNIGVPPASYRIGYTDYLRNAGLSQVAALAVPGVAGMLVLTGAGGLVGYRQAKAGHAVHTSGTARFVN